MSFEPRDYFGGPCWNLKTFDWNVCHRFDDVAQSFFFDENLRGKPGKEPEERAMNLQQQLIPFVHAVFRCQIKDTTQSGFFISNKHAITGIHFARKADLELPEDFTPSSIATMAQFEPSDAVKKGDMVGVIGYNARIDDDDANVVWERLEQAEKESIEDHKWRPSVSDLQSVFLPENKILASGVVDSIETQAEKPVALITSSIFYGTTSGLVLKLDATRVTVIGLVNGIVWHKSLNRITLINQELMDFLQSYSDTPNSSNNQNNVNNQYNVPD